MYIFCWMPRIFVGFRGQMQDCGGISKADVSAHLADRVELII